MLQYYARGAILVLVSVVFGHLSPSRRVVCSLTTRAVENKGALETGCHRQWMSRLIEVGTRLTLEPVVGSGVLRSPPRTLSIDVRLGADTEKGALAAMVSSVKAMSTSLDDGIKTARRGSNDSFASVY